MSVSMLTYWLWLAECQGLDNQTRLALLEHFDTPEAVYYASPEEILLTEGITREQAEALKNKDLLAANRILGDCQRLGLRVMTLSDGDYPGRLRNIYDSPCVLYIKGQLPVIDEEVAIAVVGTRKASPYGIECARKLSYGLAAGGALIVTGLAAGIDATAAESALRANGKVVGVLGCGIDVVYPASSRWLYEDIGAAGALVSEYPPGTEPFGRNFPARNRIMSGLSLAALVVEAPLRSGALITAADALEQGRDVFAVPGPIDAENSRGCHRLIQEGAGLAEKPWDILREYVERFPGKLAKAVPEKKLEPLRAQPREPAQRVAEKKEADAPRLSQLDVELTDDQLCVLRALTDEPAAADDIIAETELPARRVLSALTMLEVDGLIRQSSGKRYIRTVELDG